MYDLNIISNKTKVMFSSRNISFPEMYKFSFISIDFHLPIVTIGKTLLPLAIDKANTTI